MLLRRATPTCSRTSSGEIPFRGQASVALGSHLLTSQSSPLISRNVEAAKAKQQVATEGYTYLQQDEFR